jgi:hypothetical protein
VRAEKRKKILVESMEQTFEKGKGSKEKKDWQMIMKDEEN